MKRLALAAAFALTGCGHVIYRDRPVTVTVPVAQPCVGVRPNSPAPLKSKTPEWSSLDVRQKAAHVAKQGLELRTWGEQLDAATAGCP